MDYRFSPYGVFTYPFGNNLNYQRSIPGPTGIGFELTNDGNYDIGDKSLVNVNVPADDKDVVISSMFVKNMNEFNKDFANFDNRLESLITDNDDRGEYMEEVKRSVRLNTAALEAFKSEQKFLNDFLRLNMYNKVFIGVSSNVVIEENDKYLEIEKVILSSNIRIVKMSDSGHDGATYSVDLINVMYFNNEGYYRLVIHFHCQIKYNPYIRIELFGNGITQECEQRQLSSLKNTKRSDVLILKSLTSTFHAPKDNSLKVLLYHGQIITITLDEVRIIIKRIY